MYNISMENQKELVIITGAAGHLGQTMIHAFGENYDLLLVDIDLRKLEKLNELNHKRFSILKVDITSTIDLAKLSSYIKARGGFKYLIHLARVGPEVLDIASIYKVNLIGTRNLFNYLYPLIRPKGVMINIGASSSFLTPIPQMVFSLLSDPFNQKFLDNITPLTPTPKDAYWWSRYAAACLFKNDTMKWQLKEARIVSIFPDIVEKSSLNLDPCEIKTPSPVSKEIFKENGTKLVELIRYIICEDNLHMSGINVIINEDGQISYFNDFK